MTFSTDDPLVSTDWLAAHIDDPEDQDHRCILQDARVCRRCHRTLSRAHIPGAVFFDVNSISDHERPRPHMYPSAEQFARDVSALGISSGNTVVAYDAGGWVAAPRAWWMFLSFGHRDVKVLDGGSKKWLREGRPTHPAKSRPAAANFRRRSIHALSAASSNCSAISKRRRTVGRCASASALRGQCGRALAGPPLRPYSRQPQRALFRVVRRGDRRHETAGRIAACVHRGRRGHDEADRDDLRLRRIRIGPDMALYRLGVRGGALYDGSWAEWGLPDGPRVATGPA